MRKDVKLTDLTRNAGCAAKIPPGELEAVLARLPIAADPAIISGVPAGDDAAIYRLAPEINLVQTVDVMTPCVDDAYLFGRICAANCLSDIYAMGGTPRTALSILAFPHETLDGRLMYDMLHGAADTLAQAGCALVGGHSIKDEEIKLGFAVTGTLEHGEAIERGAARVGDVLVLTKPLGTGVLTFARQIGRPGVDIASLEQTMAELNKAASEAMRAVGASACTDITGFGLFGHLIGMLRHSVATARIAADALPALPGSLEALADGVIPGAIERNEEYVADSLRVLPGVDDMRRLLCFDAQTSGGLLIAISPERHRDLLEGLRDRGVSWATIGVVTGASDGRIELVNTLHDSMEGMIMPESTVSHSADCCSAASANASTASETAKAFAAFMKLAGGNGTIDARVKELITFALVIQSRCAPCLRAHLAKAAQLGISDAELEEAMWCAVAIGGAPVKMFYDETRRSL